MPSRQPDPRPDITSKRTVVPSVGIGGVLARATRFSAADAALRYAEAGIPVLPCLPGGKRPITAHGLHDATCDPAQLTAWWARWPTANIGIPTGGASGIDVVDIDVRPTGSGFAALRGASVAGLLDGWAAIVRTPSGGAHVYFAADLSRPQRCWQAASAHVDFRGDGGYVVAPPSATARGAYTTMRVAHGTRTVDASAVRRLIDPRPTRPTTPSPGRVDRVAETSRIIGWLETRQEGERNRSLFWAACRLAETGLPQTDIIAALTSPGLRIGLPEPEITAAIRSAIRTTHLTAGPAPVPQPVIAAAPQWER